MIITQMEMQMHTTSKHAGFDAFGIDWKVNKHAPVVVIVKLDLTCEDGRVAQYDRRTMRKDCSRSVSTRCKKQCLQCHKAC